MYTTISMVLMWVFITIHSCHSLSIRVIIVTTHSQVLDSLSEPEKSRIVIVVAMMDKAKNVRLERARLLYRKFRIPVDSGLIQIVAPTQNIYPANNYTAMRRLQLSWWVQHDEVFDINSKFVYKAFFCQ